MRRNFNFMTHDFLTHDSVAMLGFSRLPPSASADFPDSLELEEIPRKDTQTLSSLTKI